MGEEQAVVMKSAQGWCVLVNGFVRAIFPYGPHAAADSATFVEALNAYAESLREENERMKRALAGTASPQRIHGPSPTSEIVRGSGR